MMISERERCNPKGVFEELVHSIEQIHKSIKPDADWDFRCEMNEEVPPELTVERPSLWRYRITHNESDVLIVRCLPSNGTLSISPSWHEEKDQCQLSIQEENGEKRSISHNELWEFASKFLHPLFFPKQKPA